MSGFQIGDRVEKMTGYKFTGTVVSVYQTLGGRTRLVVECTVKGCEGMQHIYAPENIRLKEIQCS